MPNKPPAFWNLRPFGARFIFDATQLDKKFGKSMFRVPDTVRSAETPDGAVLLDVHHGQMFCLNVVGAKVLELMRRGYDESRIADEISRDYAVDRDVVRADVIEFIETLQKHHILQPARPANVG